MKILIIGDSNSIHIQGYIQNILKWNHIEKITLFNTGKQNNKYNYKCLKNIEVREGYKINKNKIIYKIPFIRSIYFHAKQKHEFKKIERHDLVHIHFLSIGVARLLKEILLKSNNIVCSLWGSDIYKTRYFDLYFKKKLLDRCKIITCVTNDVKDDILKIFGDHYKEKVKIARLGLKPLEHIKRIEEKETKYEVRKSLGFPDDAFIISIGYNARPMQQHEKILECIVDNKKELPQNIFLIFPMAYGSDSTVEYIGKIKDKLKSSDINGRVLTEYMDEEKIARFRISCDIMVNLQTSDASSGSMLEHMYADNIVINGGWLPYKEQEDLGMKFIKIDTINEISKMIIQISKDYKVKRQNCSGNKEIIYKFASWEENIKEWIKIYKGIKYE
ncbi:glycosyl transferase 4-like family protein [Clostridium baratii str. Sullivan]|uniref:Glycosyl transferase 4-like family protein n=1 Tax=Clostridium baratii str. Sullivan TaxID=1415775 RepID=A0A0A7FT92_9CLOT|nr:hypothetical protein [Clostridium baratii]AIY82792.1 glycosyl transferase 4-like family protein [Clostridium baratii str. Sullivan]